jgi:hypothetical protein
LIFQEYAGVQEEITVATVEMVSLEDARRRYAQLRHEIEVEYGNIGEFRRRAHRFDVEAPALIKYDELKEWEYLLGEQ